MGWRATVDPLSRLAALAIQLKAHRFDVELADHRLVVSNTSVVGCRERAADGGRLWFVTSWEHPIAEADRVTDAVTQIKGCLGVP